MVAKIDIITGFLGAGKTTLINRMLDVVPLTDTVAIIENEFGEINIDGQVLSRSGVTIREISAGCICCTLYGDFVAAMRQLHSGLEPTRIIVEPTGIGKLSDVLKACKVVAAEADIELNMRVAVVDCLNYEMNARMFGDFFFDQLKYADTIFLSRTQLVDDETIYAVIEQIRTFADQPIISTTPWDELTSDEIVGIAEQRNSELADFKESIFQTPNTENKDLRTWSATTEKKYSYGQINQKLESLKDQKRFGTVVRGKGILLSHQGRFLQFNYVQGQTSVEEIDYSGEGKIVIIGKALRVHKLEALFNP